MNKLTQLSYRLRLRKEFSDASIEFLQLMKEEVNREINKRNKKK